MNLHRLVLTGLLCTLFGAAACSPAEEESADEATSDRNPLLFARTIQRSGPTPDRFRVRFETTAGEFVVEAHREWSPLGVDRFHQLVRAGFYDDTRFYRVVDGFMAQFGLNGDWQVNYVWKDENLQDEPVVRSNTRGRLAFAKGGPHTRTTELYVNFADNSRLDVLGFSPFAEVVEGMEAVDRIYSGYGEGPPAGDGPYAAMIHARGNAYLDEEFPELTRIIRATVIE